VDGRAVFLATEPLLGAEGYRISVLADGTAQVAGGDETGLMYGGLEVAEMCRLGALAATEGRPAVAKRGLKINVPLDARTPSYSDAGDAARHNIPEMWSPDFWQTLLDEMARHRFNVLTLWNLHPFPSLVRVPEFPEVALDDVMRGRQPYDVADGRFGRDLIPDKYFIDLEVVCRLNMDEKIAFWREVMQHARDRGIEVYWFTWNLYAYGAAGKHGITHDQTDPVTVAYYRASVRELIRTYPLLAGIGITAGERLSARTDEYDAESWLRMTYGEGIRDALRGEPGRPFRLIHRYHDTASDKIREMWAEPPCTFDLSYKYAVAHMYSHPAPPFVRPVLAELPPGQCLWLTVRNDDLHSFRWGDPVFAREFVRALPGPGQLVGFYLGADGYTWGREFMSTEPDEPRQLIIQKHWFSFLLWGRLSYDPSVSDERFAALLANRFPEVEGGKLLRLLASAGRIVPQVNRFYWNDIDLKWFPEGCSSHPTFEWAVGGYHTVRHLVDGQAMPGAGVLSIHEWLTRPDAPGQTPPEVVGALREHATTALRLIGEIGPVTDKELRLTLGDQAAMAHLGLYYADKIAAAIELAHFDRTRGSSHPAAAVQLLESALVHWKDYAAITSRQYLPQQFARIGWHDVDQLTAHAAADVELARNAR